MFEQWLDYLVACKISTPPIKLHWPASMTPSTAYGYARLPYSSQKLLYIIVAVVRRCQVTDVDIPELYPVLWQQNGNIRRMILAAHRVAHSGIIYENETMDTLNHIFKIYVATYFFRCGHYNHEFA